MTGVSSLPGAGLSQACVVMGQCCSECWNDMRFSCGPWMSGAIKDRQGCDTCTAKAPLLRHNSAPSGFLMFTEGWSNRGRANSFTSKQGDCPRAFLDRPATKSCTPIAYQPYKLTIRPLTSSSRASSLRQQVASISSKVSILRDNLEPPTPPH